MRIARFCLLSGLLCCFLSGCNGSGSGAPENSIPPAAGANGDSTEGSPPMANDDIERATFVDLDMGAFPVLPPNDVPTSDVLHVAADGSDSTGDGSLDAPLASIQAAIDRAGDGTTIVVGGGTYDTSGLEIATDGLTIMAEPGAAVELRSSAGTQGIAISGANRVVIRGINLVGFTEAGVAFNGASQREIVLAEMTIDGSAEGIVLWGDVLDGFLVYDVRITNADLIGLHAGNGTGNNWRIEGVRIEMRGGADGSGADAFAIEHGDNILLVNTEVSGASADGIDTKATRVVIYGCYVHDIGRNGIKLWDGGDVINTVMHDTGADAAFVVERGPRVRILHSVMAHHAPGAYGMTLGYDSPSASIGFEIIDSTVFDMGAIWTNPATTLSISHSIFHDFPDEILAGQNPGSPSDYGAGNQITDPQLDAQYRPAPGGPAVNRGEALPSDYPDHDKDGNSRVQGDAPDVGPFEVE